ncbi:MAG: DUF1643 domain-containing protein [Flavobacteriaceae bacterium]|nr:DUF1643 domain-containing protein [Flavobacteriaceae bacterium]
MNEIYCLPKNDAEKRFVIGKKGKRNLLCVGLNPNTADEIKLDATSENFERIANDNGFDGWCLVNLYPTRNPKGKNLSNVVDDKLFWENINQIDTISCSSELKFSDVLLGWGDDINEKLYFKISIYQIYDRLKKLNLNYYSYRVNNSGNPSHPSPMVINTKFKRTDKLMLSEFDFDSYAKKLKAELKMMSNISIEEKEFV